MRNTQLMKLKQQKEEMTAVMERAKVRARKKKKIPRKTQTYPNMKTIRNPEEKSPPGNTTITTSTRTGLKSTSRNWKQESKMKFK